MKQISIGIISYNEEKNIINLLNSIKYQYSSNIIIKEIIISDDSNDKTPFLIREFINNNPQISIKLFHSEKRRGASSGWNEIFQEATSEYLVLYDADVILDQKTTYNLVNGFRQNVGICASNPRTLHYSSLYGKASNFITKWLENIRKTELSQFTVMGRGLAIKTDLAKKIKIPEHIIAIDYFLQIKVQELQKQVIYVNNAILYFNPPETLNDFLSQVLRANKGHKQLSFHKVKKISLILYFKITIKSILSDPFGGLATLYCYCFVPYYKIKNQKKISSKWEIAQSTKSTIIN